MNRKIAITGAGGFIGQAVVKQFKKKGETDLTFFDRNENNLSDLESLKSFVENQDVVVHLAGVNRGTNYEFLQVNTLGTLTLLEALVKFAPKTKVIFASTFQVYLPQSLYGLSKKFAEDLLIQYSLNYKIQSVILRLSNVYGPGCRPFYNSVIATFAQLIKQGETLKINGDGTQERDFIYIDDVAEAFVRAVSFEQKSSTEIVDICSGESVCLNEVIKTMGIVDDKNIEVVYNSAPKEVPWPTKDKGFKHAQSVFDWTPRTSLVNGLKKVMTSI